MLTFKPIGIEDKAIITSFTLNSNLMNCDYAFANMCSWRFLYDSMYTLADGFLFIRFYVEDNGRKHFAYMFPVGNGNDTSGSSSKSSSNSDIRHAISLLEKDAETMGFPLLFLGVTPDAKKQLDTLFPGHFTYISERDYYDYVYLREDLLTLKGKKYQAKRNHINKFKNRYDYHYRPITPELVPQCMDVERIWRKANENENDKEDLSHEQRSMVFAMQHFQELGLLGGAIVVDEKIVAFTYGSPINNHTFGTHVEKADVHYEGIFSIINQEFAAHIPEQYIYINREEDLGIPGLRQSKLSYQPTILLEKSAAIKRR